MTSYVPPRRGAEFIIYRPLVSQASRPDFQTNPTLAAGDVLVSTDGGAFANIATLPTVTPAGGTGVKFTLSIAEMTGDNVLVAGHDVAGAEWDDFAFSIQTSVLQIDDLTIPGDAMALTANAITDSVLAADTDTYQAKVILLDDEDNSVDRYAVSWFRNGQPVNTGITVPTIQVVKVADGSNLIPVTAMTQIAALGRYRYTASAAERITSGLAYLAIVTATIDSASRTWDQYVGRDSS